jgi:cob(I)alamin adenosyltransferase
LITIKQVLELLDSKPASVELVLTGRNAPPEISQRADLVTEMLMIKHPFTDGTCARRGIEY